jgi:hypothetical protein
MTYRLKIKNVECEPRDFTSIKAWFEAGAISGDDEVFNPAFDRWQRIADFLNPPKPPKLAQLKMAPIKLTWINAGQWLAGIGLVALACTGVVLILSPIQKAWGIGKEPGDTYHLTLGAFFGTISFGVGVLCHILDRLERLLKLMERQERDNRG